MIFNRRLLEWITALIIALLLLAFVAFAVNRSHRAEVHWFTDHQCESLPGDGIAYLRCTKVIEVRP